MGKQEEVDLFISRYDLDIEPEYRALDVVAELGEVAKKILEITDYGGKDLQATENLEIEIGDLYFSIIVLANRLEIDLDLALEKVLEKYEDRLEDSSNPSSRKS